MKQRTQPDNAMDLAAFHASLAGAKPPSGLDPALQALWQLKKGDWKAAHALAQKNKGAAGHWVHAHLHRVEGDKDNAGYWYGRAGKPFSQLALEAEWDEIAAALLARKP